jgi:hypothetical protein
VEKDGLKQEIDILFECDHPHVMGVYGHFEQVMCEKSREEEESRERQRAGHSERKQNEN